jgi:hypothetical protein
VLGRNNVWSSDERYGQGGLMKGIFNCIGFFVENLIDFESPPEIIGLRSSSIEDWGLLSS